MNTQTCLSSAARPTIVLVHGAWRWGGCFGKLADLLGAQGFPVVAPDLTSHGFSDAGYADVTSMVDYAAPVARVLEAATEPVVLLGHSMGGATLTHLAERHPEKIAQLIYLTAFMTPSGKSPNDCIFDPATSTDPAAAEIFQLLSASADGKGVVLDTSRQELLRAAFYADCSDRDFAVARANVVATNMGLPYATPSDSTAERFGRIPSALHRVLSGQGDPDRRAAPHAGRRARREGRRPRHRPLALLRRARGARAVDRRPPARLDRLIR